MQVKSKHRVFIYLIPVLTYACIGIDIIDDFIEARIAMVNKVEALIVGDFYQFEAAYFDNIGLKQPVQFDWTTSDRQVLEINENGLALAVAPGTVTITSSVNGLTSSVEVAVFDPSIVNEDSILMQQTPQGTRTAELKTVSSYPLEGTVTLSNQRLEFSTDFKTTSALPGLYVYLTNNTSTINNALEIGAVEEFSGSQVYDVPENVQLQDYSHVLFYCKPFLVPVGNGKLEP